MSLRGRARSRPRRARALAAVDYAAWSCPRVRSAEVDELDELGRARVRTGVGKGDAPDCWMLSLLMVKRCWMLPTPDRRGTATGEAMHDRVVGHVRRERVGARAVGRSARWRARACPRALLGGAPARGGAADLDGVLGDVLRRRRRRSARAGRRRRRPLQGGARARAAPGCDVWTPVFADRDVSWMSCCSTAAHRAGVRADVQSTRA